MITVHQKRKLAKYLAIIGLIIVLVWEAIVMIQTGRIPLDVSTLPSSPIQFVILLLFAVFLGTSSILYEDQE